MLWGDLEDAWRKTCQIFRKWIKTLEKGECFANIWQSFSQEWRLIAGLFGIIDSNVEKYPPTRPYCPRTCVESFRGKNGNERKRRLWRGLLGRSTMRTLEDKVSVPSSYLHSCNDNKWWVMVSKMCLLVPSLCQRLESSVWVIFLSQMMKNSAGSKEKLSTCSETRWASDPKTTDVM